ncbi:MAG: YggS family pyridoxal phosphate-dependent enzyme [Deltaproteobacteria bacterium]|nr:YggS family pyridoxal phosphate-dependent enzyme [Deltaproteobacteria bacterium]
MKERIKNIKERIENAAAGYGRDPKDITLVAVSKTIDAQRIKEAFYCGCNIFGENYIQEAEKKIKALADIPIQWHFIGRLQSNKAKYAVKFFELIHSVDSVKLAKALNKEAVKINKVQNVLIQINISGEVTKSGAQEDEAESIIKQISEFDNLSVCGLMTMPPFFDDPQKAAPYFKELYSLSKNIERLDIKNVSMKYLSMGMTGDFEAAIGCGSTIVRIGTAIFGAR